MVNLPVMFGNCSGSKSLHGSNRIIGGRDWAARVPDLAAAINASGCWVFGATEVHAPDDEWKDSSYPAGGHQYLLAALKTLNAEWAIAAGAEGNWTYYRSSKLTVTSFKNVHYSPLKISKKKKIAFDRGFTDVLFTDKASGFQEHVLNTHLTAHQEKYHDQARAMQMRELVAYAKKLGFAVIGGDINSSVYRSGFPRDIATKAGWFGLRERVGVSGVTNGGLSSFSTSPKKDYWLDEVFTRKQQTVTSPTLVLTNGVNGSNKITDHNWLKVTVGFDAGAIPGSPTGAYIAPIAVDPVKDALPPTTNPWVASLRMYDYSLAGPIDFTKLTLTENLHGADRIELVGRSDDLEEAAQPGLGLVLVDDRGHQRFSGNATRIRHRGDGRTEMTYLSDSADLWTRKCYPVPTADWSTGQTLAYDVLNGTAEDRIISLVSRNLGPAALKDQPGFQPRSLPLLRVPASLGRGPINAPLSVRFNTLGDVVATLAEQADLRVRIVQTYTGWTPWWDLVIDDMADYSATVSFGPPEGGGPYMLSNDWFWEISVPTGSTILSAAGGDGADRILDELTDGDAEDSWGKRFEMVLDQRGTTDPAEISNKMLEALAQNAGPSLVSVPIGDAPGLGSAIPLGSQVGMVLRGVPLVDRIRQLTTVLTNEDNEPRVKTTGVIGSPDNGVQGPAQQSFTKLQRRVQNLENT